MIFVAVGTQLPFDRLIRAVDQWAGSRQRADIVAQVGPSSYRACHIQAHAFLPPPEFRRYVEAADAVVAHAGMGTIISALELGKPVLVMPRRADLGEHRNDHQIATARRFLEQGRISVAFDERELVAALDTIHGADASERISTHASPELIDAIRGFIAHGGTPGKSR